jgi:GTPase SAR1 family protein
MGGCGSKLSEEEKAELQRSKELQRQAEKDRQAEANKLKLLLLGAGESGKSTLFKQMKILFSESHGFTQSELQAGVKVVFNNIINNMKVLLMNCEHHTPAEDSELADEICQLPEGASIDAELCEKLKSIWVDPGVRATWDKRSTFQVQDALEYFMENIDRISKPGYLPENQDILRSRVRTSGIVEAEYNLNGVRIAMFDVGGQRNERKKWIHCFDNVTAIIFVAAISEYDQVLYEDADTNRQEEALELFAEMCNSSWFRNKSMILFLNKRDVFRKKLQTIPFKVLPGGEDPPRNVDYNGPVAVPGEPSSQDGTSEFEAVYEGTTQYLTKLYKDKGSGQGKTTREIYVKVTCATDSDQVKVVMESCKDIILKNNLTENGFM